jgi:hypothetical protein
MPIPAIIVDENFAKATYLFNPNAFSTTVKPDAMRCGDSFAVLTHSVDIVLREPGLDRSRLLREVRENDAFKGFTPTPDKPVVLMIHNLNFVTGLHSALIAVKSLLDLYSRLVAKSLVPSASVFGFKSGQFGGRNVSGGRFLRWLEHSVPRSFQHRARLVSLFLAHVDGWLNKAVAYRDAVVHDGFVPGMREASVPLDKPLAQLKDHDVVLPHMPDGAPVADYCQELVRSTRTLVSETLPLLPGVDLKLLSLGEK